MYKYKKVVHGRHEGKIVLKDKIVDGIIFLAVSELPYVSFYTNSPFSKKTGNENIKVSINKNNVSVQICVKIHYNQNISDMAFKIQETIRHNIESMTEFHVISVNVVVKGVMFEERTEIKPVEPEPENEAKEPLIDPNDKKEQNK